MDIRKIKTLIDLIDKTGVSEIEIREGEESVRISRKIEPTATQYMVSPSHAGPVRTTRPNISACPHLTFSCA